jgi:hypothetical protein
LSSLADNTEYTLSLDGVEDDNAINSNAMAAAKVWTFTTDFSAPTIASTTPANNASAVINTTLTTVFSENVQDFSALGYFQLSWIV